MYDEDRIRQVFPEATIYKDPSVTATFKDAEIEAFLRDWIIKKKAGPDGRISDPDSLGEFVSKLIPKRKDKEKLADEARNGITRPFLARINVSFNSKKNYECFEIPDLGFGFDETIIEDYVWNRIKEDLLADAGGWGVINLGYNPPLTNQSKGLYALVDYRNFRPYDVDVDAYRRARARYEETEEWMDVLLGAIDYESDGFRKRGYDHDRTWSAKHTMLTRLLPSVHPRVNLMELAPQQTGKSYVFGKINKYGWLASGGSLTRAKMFYDMRPGSKPQGLVTFNDYVAIDEIKSVNFKDEKEMVGILKGYMEDGFVNVGGTKVTGDAGIIFMGNINVEDMRGGRDMFKDLPDFFRDTALIQRIHGFVPGDRIPPLSPDMYKVGWALNTEYFTEILHSMRSPSETLRYGELVKSMIGYTSEDSVSGREVEAVRKLCTAYMKLFFPHADSELIRDPGFQSEFEKYCLRPAVEMQKTVLEQMQIINPDEFGSKRMADYYIRRGAPNGKMRRLRM